MIMKSLNKLLLPLLLCISCVSITSCATANNEYFSLDITYDNYNDMVSHIYDVNKDHMVKSQSFNDNYEIEKTYILGVAAFPIYTVKNVKYNLISVSPKRGMNPDDMRKNKIDKYSFFREYFATWVDNDNNYYRLNYSPLYNIDIDNITWHKSIKNSNTTDEKIVTSFDLKSQYIYANKKFNSTLVSFEVINTVPEETINSIKTLCETSINSLYLNK